MALVVKNPPANAGDTRDVGLIPGGSLEDPLEESMAAPPVSLPGESHRGLQSVGSQKGWTRLSRPENQMGRLDRASVSNKQTLHL